MGCVLSPHSFCFHWEDFLHQSNWEQAAANEMVHSQRERGRADNYIRRWRSCRLRITWFVSSQLAQSLTVQQLCELNTLHFLLTAVEKKQLGGVS